MRDSCQSRYREAFSLQLAVQLAVVGPVVPDLIGEVAAQKPPYFF